MLYPAELRVRRGRVHSTCFWNGYGKMLRSARRRVGVHVRSSEKISETAADHDSQARLDAARCRIYRRWARLSNWNDTDFGVTRLAGTEAALRLFETPRGVQPRDVP